MRPARGQAMVETAVSVAVFALLLAGLPAFAAWHDVQRNALRAARDAVVLEDWNRGRRSVERVEALATAGFAALPWRHPADGRPLLPADPAPRVATSNAAPPGEAARLLEFIAAPLRAGGFLGPQFALVSTGFRGAQVQVTVPGLRGAPAPLDELALELQGRAVLLTDAWNAAGSTQVLERTAGLVPTQILREAQRPLSILGAGVRLVEPDIARLCIGLIEPERVPASRLQDGRARRAPPAAGSRCP